MVDKKDPLKEDEEKEDKLLIQVAGDTVLDETILNKNES